MSTVVTMHTTKTIQLNWKVPSDISQDHLDALDESGMERAMEMIKEGFVEGELHDNIHMHDSDPEDGVEYSGYWRLSTTRKVSPAASGTGSDEEADTDV